MGKIMFLVGKMRGMIKISNELKCKGKYPIWEFQGIFDLQEKAIEACVNENYFCVEVDANVLMPKNTCYFDNVIFPAKVKK